MKRIHYILTLSIVFGAAAFGQVYLTKDEALKQYFPTATSIDRKTLFLTDQEVQNIQRKARSKVDSKIVTYYIGRRGTEALGYAFLETQIVRTMPETFMVVIDPEGAVEAVEILAFFEPEDYLPPKRWLALFRRKTSESDLWLKRGIQNIVGATLSAQGITEGVRKALVLYELAVSKEK